MLFRPRLLPLFLVAFAGAASAQSPEPVAVKPVYTPPVVPDSTPTEPVEAAPQRPGCWRAQPRPQCTGFFLTEFGVEAPLYSSRSLQAGRMRRDFPLRLVWSFGFMGTTGRHSHGGAVALTSDWMPDDGVPFIVEYRYRNWLDASAAMDASVGFKRSGVHHAPDASVTANGVTAMVGYTPNRWIGLSLRGDVVRARGRNHHAIMAGVQSTRASEFIVRGFFVAAVRALLGAIGLEVEEEE